MNDPARAGRTSGARLHPPGTLLGNRFRVKAHLGSDGAGELYRASDAQSGDDAAVWALTPSGPARALLERELAKAQRLGPHKNIARITAVLSQGPELLVAQEWPEGHTLREIIDAQRKQEKPVDADRAHTLLGHVAAALEHAASEMPHGALCPNNIWLSSSGRLRITDLGLGTAWPALLNLRAGTPATGSRAPYLAPEVTQGRSSSPSPAADVYSLGAILFELLTLTPPTPPLTPPSRLVAGLTPAIDAVVGRALLPSPGNRYTTATDMLRALGTALSNAAATSAAMLGAAPDVGASADTTGRPFDVAAAAGLSQEEARWLVQKDRLDFGPFSLAQLKAQIEQGVFRGDNLIVDMDSGERQKIIDHPQLGDFARHSERRLEHTRRVQAEHAHESVERKKFKAFALIIGAAVLVIGGGLTLYLKNRQAAGSGELASRAGDADIDEFLKGVKVNFPSTKRPTSRRAARGGGGGKDDPFNTTTNLGDVSQGGADAILSDRVIQSVMMANYRKLIPCVMDERRRNPSVSEMDMEFIVAGDGKVSAAKVNGDRNGPLPSCVLGKMRSFNFPKYDGSRTIASWSMSVR
jgi:hypothetical protein